MKNSSTETEQNKIVEHQKKPMKISPGIILIILFLAIYLPILGRWIFVDTIQTDVVRQGNIEEVVNATGVILRDETIFPSEIAGKYIYEVVESKKVPKGFTVASVVNASGETILNEIKSLNTKIRDAQIKSNQNNDLYADDLQRIDMQVKAQVDILVAKSFYNDFKYSDNQRRELDNIIQGRANFGGNNSESAEIKTLKAQLATLETQKQTNTFKVISPMSGMVSYVIDGYEDVLLPEKPDTLTPEIYEKIKQEKNMNYNLTDIVEKGKPFVKLITGNYIYIGVYTDENIAQKLKPLLESTIPAKNSIQLRINDAGKTVEAQVNSISEPLNGKYLIIFKTSDLTIETSQLRKLNVDIVIKEIDGYKVPIKSLMNYKKYGDTAKIMLVEAATTIEKDVKCLGDDGVFAIIEPGLNEKGNENVSLYDKFVITPEKVKEGQMITK